jgi:acetyltransferase
MRSLMAIARNRDLEVIEGQVLRKTEKMLELTRSLNFRIESDAEDSSIKRGAAKLHSFS